MKVLTAEQMRAIDRRTMEAGVPELVLMENAGCRVAEFLAERFAPLAKQRIVVMCGKGNNGGDGLVVARQLQMLHGPASLDVVLPYGDGELSAGALANLKMLRAHGVAASAAVEPLMRAATLVVDAILGTGLRGPAAGEALEMIREVNGGFPGARVVAVDMPSGAGGGGEHTWPEATVTFTAPKVEQVMPPWCNAVGELVVKQIGTPQEWLEEDESLSMALVTPEMFRGVLGERARGAHKGDFGHVLVIGGAQGKGGAAAMAGYAALSAGAGLVTVAAAESERGTVTALAPELMTQEQGGGWEGKEVIAVGPGLGLSPEGVELVRGVFAEANVPVVVDADGLNALAGWAFQGRGLPRVLTPHPGEMGRLIGLSTAGVQADRAAAASGLAAERNVVVVLKGQRTLTAMPDGRLFINPTGTPAMATAGSGDILTGLIAGMMAQWPGEWERALLAAVWLHGRAGELAAEALTENCVTATDLVRFLPEAIREAREIRHQ